jgi:hypothetical protein
MASSRSRKLRRLHLSVKRKASAIRWMGQWTVQVQVDVGKRTTRPVSKKADKGAEKSRAHTRRKRGLRKGHVRSRVCQTRRSIVPPATSPKTQSARLVNHRGRKFIWAVCASNQFRRDCQKYLKIKKFLRGPNGVEHRPIGIRSRLRRRWETLSNRAKLLDIPYQAAFHRTFWDYLQIECRYDATSTWNLILEGLPRKSEPKSEVGELFSFGEPDLKRQEGVVTKTDEFGNSRFVEPTVCKFCSGLGAKPGFGYPLGCSHCYQGHPQFLKKQRFREAEKKRRGRRPEDVKTGG